MFPTLSVFVLHLDPALRHLLPLSPPRPLPCRLSSFRRHLSLSSFLFSLLRLRFFVSGTVTTPHRFISECPNRVVCAFPMRSPSCCLSSGGVTMTTVVTMTLITEPIAKARSKQMRPGGLVSWFPQNKRRYILFCLHCSRTSTQTAEGRYTHIF
ncbi:hypothetical protein F4823DRAFT_156338 [Ustulina deusta]|nr:hypothetical protein F4823DRAFT_156338 [Ustulina deusta]